MYRFNGHDLRIDRQLEAMLMVMEAFENYETKVKVSIHKGKKGHVIKNIDLLFIAINKNI